MQYTTNLGLNKPDPSDYADIAKLNENMDTLDEAVAGKVDKVAGAMAGNLAALDSSGNLTDSGKKPTDFGGKRTARLTVGTSASGWTAGDCDYLCDGTADDVEINAAIQALPSTGGEIVILDGTYNITATIVMNKGNVKLSGNGTATALTRMWDSTIDEGVITITATNGGCCVVGLQIDGNNTTYTGTNNSGIYVIGSNNTITGNTCCGNVNGIYISGSNNTIAGNACNDNRRFSIYVSGSGNTITGNACCDNANTNGIYLSSGENNTITGNTCNNNNNGIHISGSNNTVTGNTCNDNDLYGIYLSSGSNNTVTGNTCNDNSTGIVVSSTNNSVISGNTCMRGTGQSSDYSSSQYTIRLFESINNYNLIADNIIMGKNYVSGGGTSNTFVNNKFE